MNKTIKKEIICCILIIWICSGILTYSMGLAYSQNEWPTLTEKDCSEDITFSAIIGLFGPISLTTGLLMGEGKYGFQFTCNEPKEYVECDFIYINL